MTATPTDPVAQAKGCKIAAVSLAVAGLLIGVGLPVALILDKPTDAMTPLGFEDFFWLVSLVMMVVDFAVAWWFWRRAIGLERSA